MYTEKPAETFSQSTRSNADTHGAEHQMSAPFFSETISFVNYAVGISFSASIAFTSLTAFITSSMSAISTGVWM